MFRPVSSPDRLFDEYNRDARDRQLRQEAAQRFGISDTRPQELDPALMRSIRRVNLGLAQPFPENYEHLVHDWIQQMPQIGSINIAEELFLLGAFTTRVNPVPRGTKVIRIQDKHDQNLVELLEGIKAGAGFTTVLAVEFHLHNEYSYDGLMCWASIATQNSVLLVDLLDQNTEFARRWMEKMLVGKRTLKVLIECDNYIYRLQKDWGCFPYGFLDLQCLFVVWKTSNREDCFQTCRKTLETRLKRRGITDVNLLESYFSELLTPGIGLLTEIFDSTIDVRKLKSLEFADWRKRPLHPDLVQYSSLSSYMILTVFYHMHAKVGDEGVKAALQLTARKLLTHSSLPRYENNLISSVAGQSVVEQLLKWRHYLAINLDKPEEQILLNRQVPVLADKIQRIDGEKTPEVISKLLAQCKVDDDFKKAANLLVAYLDNEGAKLQDMATVICHNCFTIGHVAKFCFRDPDPVARKEFMNRPENARFKSHQNDRRRVNWCNKRGLDPLTTVCPWEQQKD